MICHNLKRSMNSIEIRLAKKEDAQFIALLGRITFTETFGHFLEIKRFDRLLQFDIFSSKN